MMLYIFTRVVVREVYDFRFHRNEREFEFLTAHQFDHSVVVCIIPCDGIGVGAKPTGQPFRKPNQTRSELDC